MVEENKEAKKSALLNPPKPPTEEGKKSALLNPPKPPTKGEMSAREKKVARHTVKEQSEGVALLKAVLLVVLAVMVVCEVVIFSSPYLRSPLKDWVTGIIAEQGYKREAKQLAEDWNKEYKKETGEQLISSGVVADGKMAATITGKPVVKDDTVSFTVEWENKGSNSTYILTNYNWQRNPQNHACNSTAKQTQPKTLSFFKMEKEHSFRYKQLKDKTGNSLYLAGR